MDEFWPLFVGLLCAVSLVRWIDRATRSRRSSRGGGRHGGGMPWGPAYPPDWMNGPPPSEDWTGAHGSHDAHGGSWSQSGDPSADHHSHHGHSHHDFGGGNSGGHSGHDAGGGGYTGGHGDGGAGHGH